MKISCLPWGILLHRGHDANAYRDWFNFVARTPAIQGVDFIDNNGSLFGTLARRQESREFRPLLEELGLQVVMFVAHTDFRSAMLSDQEHDRLKFLIGQAAYFKAAFFRVLTGTTVPGELFRPGVLENVLAGLKTCLDLAKKAGLALLLENHHETTDELLTLCDSLADDGLRLNCEIKPPFRYGMSPTTFVKRLTPFASCYHIDNFKYAVGGWDKDRAGRALERAIPVNAGEIDIQAILTIIKESGFNGWLSMEYGGRVDRFDDLAASAAYLRNTWDKS